MDGAGSPRLDPCRQQVRQPSVPSSLCSHEDFNLVGLAVLSNRQNIAVDFPAIDLQRLDSLADMSGVLDLDLVDSISELPLEVRRSEMLTTSRPQQQVRRSRVSLKSTVLFGEDRKGSPALRSIGFEIAGCMISTFTYCCAACLAASSMRSSLMAPKESLSHSQSHSTTLQQKRVDVMPAVDLTLLSARRQISDAILAAGDSDFIPPVDVARNEGVVVWLYDGTKNSPHNDLWQLADERVPLTQEFIDSIRLPPQ